MGRPAAGSPVLPQPASSASSNGVKHRLRVSKRSSSPLVSKNTLLPHMSASSPIKNRTSLPSPSPEHHQIARSSPLKKRKKVAFNVNLIQSRTPRQPDTPRKSILRTPPTQAPPQMGPLSTTPDLKYTHLNFWSPGNIPSVDPSDSLAIQLQSFAELLEGGLYVLRSPECERRFEVYASFHLLLKSLTDKKLSILLPLLPDLLNVLRCDLEKIDKLLMNKVVQDPFLARTNVQIVKIFSILLSNTKIVNNFWSRAPKDTKAHAPWCVLQSSSVIRRDTVSKSLLSANLQLLKDQKVYSMLTQNVKEYILHALINMKFFNSASILHEKILALKQLIIHCSPMMEKNVKSWIGFLFNCLCDFSTSTPQKTVTSAASSATFVLLEAAKAYINSKSVNFELKMILSSPIFKTLNIAPSSFVSISSTPIDLQQPTLLYIIDRLFDLVKSDNEKVVLDIWLGITLLLFNDTAYLDKNPMEGSDWFSILDSCLLSKRVDSQMAALRAWRGVIYVNSNNLEISTSEQLNTKLNIIFKVFQYGDLLLMEHSQQIFCSIITQISYALLNNPRLEQHMTAATIDQYFIFLFDHLLTLKHHFISSHVAQVLIHLLTPQSTPDYGYFSIKVMSNDKVDIQDIKPLSTDVVLQLHPHLLALFRDKIWANHDISSNLQLSVLSSLMVRVKSVPQIQMVGKRAEKVCDIVKGFKEFFATYMAHIPPSVQVGKEKPQAREQRLADEKLDHINRFLILVKTNLGLIAFSEVDDIGELVYSHDNIYLIVLQYCLSHTSLKVTEILKCLFTHIKMMKYKFFETLALRVDDQIVHNYISNNLQSVIVDQGVSTSNLHALARTITLIPKNTHLLKTFFLTVSKSDNPKPYFQSLDVTTWQIEDAILIYRYVIKNHSAILKSAVVDAIFAKLQDHEPEYAFKILDYLIDSGDYQGLFELRDHIFYFAIDPNSSFNEEFHIKFLYIFKSFVAIISSGSDLSQLDSIIYQALILCSNLNSNSKYQVTTGRVTAVRNAVQKCIGGLNEQTIKEMPLLNKFLTLERTQNEITIASPRTERILRSFNRPVPTTDVLSSIVGHNDVNKDAIPTDSASVRSFTPPLDAEDNNSGVQDSVIVSSSNIDSRQYGSAESTKESSGMDETQVIAEMGESVVNVVNSSSQELIDKRVPSIENEPTVHNPINSLTKDSNTASTQVIMNPLELLISKALVIPPSAGSAIVSSTQSAPNLTSPFKKTIELTEKVSRAPEVIIIHDEEDDCHGSIIHGTAEPVIRESSCLENKELSLTSDQVIPDSNPSTLDDDTTKNAEVAQLVAQPASSDIDSSPFKNIEDSIKRPMPSKRKLNGERQNDGSPNGKRPRLAVAATTVSTTSLSSAADEDDRAVFFNSSPTKSMTTRSKSLELRNEVSTSLVLTRGKHTQLAPQASGIVDDICVFLGNIDKSELPLLSMEQKFEIQKQMISFMSKMNE